MESAGISPILKLLLILFLSVQDGPQDAGRSPALEILAPAGALGYAALDVAQLRALIRDDPEVAKALFAGSTAEASYGEAVEALNERTHADPAALREAVARVRTVGLWAMGMGEQQPRFVAVFDRGGAPDILPKLFGTRPAGGSDAPRTVTYAGRTLYAVSGDQRVPLWFAEVNGILVLASDNLAAETVLLKARAAASPSPAARPAAGAVAARRSILQVNADVGAVVNGAVVNGLLAALGHGDQAEFMAMSAFVDLAAWRGASLRMDRDSVVLRAEIDPGSPLAAALKPPERLPALLDAIPADAGLALAVSVRDTVKVWQLFEAGFNHIAILERGNVGPREEFIRDFNRETGLDVQADLVSNLVAAAVMMTDPSKGLDIEQGGALFFEGKDPERTLAAVRIMLARMDNQDKTSAEDRTGVKVWRTADALIALKGNVVLLAPSRGEAQAPTERLLKHFIEGGENLRKTLAARHPGATTFATVDGSRCFPQAGLERLTAGLTIDATGLTVRVEGGGRNLAGGILRLLAGAGHAAATQATQNQVMNSLRQISAASEQYALDHAKLPANISDIKPYIANPEVALRDARTGQLFQLNPAVAGRPKGSVKNPGATVLAYAPPAQDAKTICVAFCDGSIHLLTPAQLDAALNPTTHTE